MKKVLSVILASVIIASFISQINPAVDTYAAKHVKLPSYKIKSGHHSSSHRTSSDSGKKMKIKKWILVGDSRYVQMSRTKGLNKKSDYYVCKGSMGLNWMKTQEKKIKKAQTKNAVIIIGMGVNDTYQTARYVTYLKKAKFKCPVYFCTINPVDTRKYHGFTNRRVEGCNRIIKKGAKKGHYKVIDTYHMLKKNGFDTWDGLHYKAGTYDRIYRYIKREVKKDIGK